MKYILIMMFCLCSAVATSQARVGHHITMVRHDFPEVKELNDSVFVWNTLNAAVRYYTDSLGFVTESVIYPLTKKDERIYISYYDKAFTKRGYSSWVYKADGDSCFITKVRKGDSDSVYFIWSFDNQIKPNY